MKDNKDFLDNYEIIRKLTEVNFGTIYEAKHKESNEKRAIKVIDKQKIKEAYNKTFSREPNSEEMKPYINCLLNEIKNMQIAEGENKDNENTVKFFEFFDNDKEFAIIMELCDDNLLNYISKQKDNFSLEEKMDIINQINKTLKLIDEKKILYKNLRLENILLKYKNEEKTKYIIKLKLNDDSRLLRELSKLFTTKDINYNAPEILKGEQYDDKSVLWNLGIIIYVLFFNDFPYKGNNEKEILDKIKNGEENLKKTGISDLDDLIRNLLVEDPEKRMNWKNYFEHPFFKEEFLNFYEIIQKIGETRYAVVYKVKEKKSSEIRAIKVFDKRKIISNLRRKYFREPTDEEMEPYINSFFNEKNHMEIVEGKNKENNNTVKLYEYFDNKDEFAIVMELCDDNLLSPFAKRKGPFNPEEIYDILNQLNNSFKIMSQNQLVHRDLNLENILVKYENEEKTKFIVKLKLTNDSGLLKDLPKIPRTGKLDGNLNFMAPEILNREEYNEKCDLWSLGVLIYVLYFKEYPFDGDSEEEILEQINHIDEKIEEKVEGLEQDETLVNLIRKLLIKEPEKRLTWKEYFNHPFFRQKEDFKKYYELCTKIGETEFAKVYKAKVKETNEARAIKIFDIIKIRDLLKSKYLREINYTDINPYIESFNNEVKNMQIVQGSNKRNNNTVKFYEYFHTKDEFVIIMELCDDNLLNLFSSKKDPFTSKEINEILNQLNNSFKIMVKNKLVHRALNLENILIKYENEDKSKYNVKLKLTESSGLISNLKNLYKFDKNNINLNFISPEILKGEKINEKCDLWSLGIIIYSLYFKKYPFSGDSTSEILNQIKNSDEILKKKTDDSVLDDLLHSLLIEDQEKRISWKEYFEHPFFIKREDGDFRNYYEIEAKIGEAGYAYVYKAKNKQNNEKRAIKVFDKKKIISNFRRKNLRNPTDEEMEPYINSFFNEKNHMEIVEGKNKENNNTVKFYEYFHNKDEFAIVMELCDDNLLSPFAKRKGPFNPEEIYDILNQLNNSFKIMSQNQLVHRDLNLENILVKYENEEKTKFIVKLKLTNDSGLLKDLPKIPRTGKLDGNLNFMAPEILNREEYNEKCDLWSLGVLIYVLYFKQLPFDGENEEEIIEKINNIQNLKKINNLDLDDLIQNLLVKDPQKRLSWDQYFAHSFFSKNKH